VFAEEARIDGQCILRFLRQHEPVSSTFEMFVHNCRIFLV